MKQSTHNALAGAEEYEVVEFPSESSADVLTELLRGGARKFLVVRNGPLPERTIQTGLGDVPVRKPRVRDKRAPEERERFKSSILLRYRRRTKSVEELLPWLYPTGESTGDFNEALAAPLGPDASGLSATAVTRLESTWEDEYKTWSRRSLAGKRYAYVWADGVYFNVRLEDAANVAPHPHDQPDRIDVLNCPASYQDD